MNIDEIKKLHAVIDRREAEWREEQNEPVVSTGLRTRRKSGLGIAAGKRFSADRFAGKSSQTPLPEKEHAEIPPEPEEKAEKTEEKAEKTEEKEKPESGKAEIISVIKQKENKPHSWLYNEVLKAVNDAAGNDKNTKVIAIFIPVVQSGKEFEDLPIDSSVTLPPVNENEIENEEIHIENLVELSELTGAGNESETDETESHVSNNDSDNGTEEAAENPDIAESVDDIFPPDQEKPDPELAKAYETIKENLEVNQDTKTDSEPENPEIPPLKEVISFENENENEAESDENFEENEEENESEIPAGEEMPHEELPLNESDAYRTVEDILMPEAPDENEDEAEFSDPLAAIQILGEDSEEEEKEENSKNP